MSTNRSSRQIVEVPFPESVVQSCPSCADRLLSAVRALPGVAEAETDSGGAKLRLAVDAEQIEAAEIAREAERIGARLSDEFGHRTYRVHGMDCTNCAESIEKAVSALPGVVSASINFPTAKLRVEYANGTAGVEQITSRAGALGFRVEDTARGAAEPADTSSSAALHRKLLSAPARVALSGLLLLLGLILEHGLRSAGPWADGALAASVVVGGYRFALAGLRALRTFSVGTNLLMALAAVGAAIIGHWEEAAAVVFLYALGEALEGAAMERTRRSLSALIEAAPNEARVRRPDGREEMIPAALLSLGDVILVEPGAKIAADGRVCEGVSAVAEAAITGESLPRSKAPGDTVYAGSVNGNGALAVEVTAAATDSTLARILHLVEEAQAQKAPTQALVERFGRIYTPLVIAAAIGLAVIGPFVSPGQDWLYRALTLLVVSCPCALIIATPVAYVSGIARAARGGVLVKGGAFLEALAGVRHAALDKTGTMTQGKPQVTRVHALMGSEDDLLALAASVERRSEHPLADAVVREAERRGVPFHEARNVLSLPGRGHFRYPK